MPKGQTPKKRMARRRTKPLRKALTGMGKMLGLTPAQMKKKLKGN